MKSEIKIMITNKLFVYHQEYVSVEAETFEHLQHKKIPPRLDRRITEIIWGTEFDGTYYHTGTQRHPLNYQVS